MTGKEIIEARAVQVGAEAIARLNRVPFSCCYPISVERISDKLRDEYATGMDCPNTLGFDGRRDNIPENE